MANIGLCALLRLILEESDEIVPVLAFLETAECHLGAWDVLLRVLEVVELPRLLASHSPSRA